MTFGRPAAIPESYIKLELPAHYEGSSPSAVKHASMLFFNATM